MDATRIKRQAAIIVIEGWRWKGMALSHTP